MGPPSPPALCALDGAGVLRPADFDELTLTEIDPAAMVPLVRAALERGT